MTSQMSALLAAPRTPSLLLAIGATPSCHIRLTRARRYNLGARGPAAIERPATTPKRNDWMLCEYRPTLQPLTSHYLTSHYLQAIRAK